MKAYIFLTISIVTEIFGTAMLKLSDGFTVLLPSLGVIIGYSCSFFFLGLTLKTMPLSVAYAIWSGAGTALTVLVSVLLWGEVLTALKIAGILLIIGGVVLCNSMETSESKVNPTN